jgi:hypothetical protein
VPRLREGGSLLGHAEQRHLAHERGAAPKGRNRSDQRRRAEIEPDLIAAHAHRPAVAVGAVHRDAAVHAGRRGLLLQTGARAR